MQVCSVDLSMKIIESQVLALTLLLLIKELVIHLPTDLVFGHLLVEACFCHLYVHFLQCCLPLHLFTG